jgi:hypothetical protein
MFTRAATGVLVQSEDETRATHIVDCVKILWDQSLPALKARWKPLNGRTAAEQPYNTFSMANGSWVKGIPGNPDKVRSDHPTIIILDEAAHMTRGESSFNIAQATRCLHIICISSACPGWFTEQTELAIPVDWPDYSKSNAA